MKRGRAPRASPALDRRSRRRRAADVDRGRRGSASSSTARSTTTRTARGAEGARLPVSDRPLRHRGAAPRLPRVGRRLRRAAEWHVGLRHLRPRAAAALRQPRSVRQKAALLLSRRRHVRLCQRAARAARSIRAAPRSISALSLKKYFAYCYIPAPRSIYERVWKLPGGHSFTLRSRRARTSAAELCRAGGSSCSSPMTATSRTSDALCEEHPRHARARRAAPAHVRRAARRLSQRRHRFLGHRRARGEARPRRAAQHLLHRLQRAELRRIAATRGSSPSSSARGIARKSSTSTKPSRCSPEIDRAPRRTARRRLAAPDLSALAASPASTSPSRSAAMAATSSSPATIPSARCARRSSTRSSSRARPRRHPPSRRAPARVACKHQLRFQSEAHAHGPELSATALECRLDERARAARARRALPRADDRLRSSTAKRSRRGTAAHSRTSSIARCNFGRSFICRTASSRKSIAPR